MFVIIMVTMRTTQKIVYIPLFLRLPNNLSFYLHSTKEINWRKCIQWSEKKHLKNKSISIYDFLKKSQQGRIEGNLLKVLKNIYQKPTAHTTFNGE